MPVYVAYTEKYVEDSLSDANVDGLLPNFPLQRIRTFHKYSFLKTIRRNPRVLGLFTNSSKATRFTKVSPTSNGKNGFQVIDQSVSNANVGHFLVYAIYESFADLSSLHLSWNKDFLHSISIVDRKEKALKLVRALEDFTEQKIIQYQNFMATSERNPGFGDFSSSLASSILGEYSPGSSAYWMRQNTRLIKFDYEEVFLLDDMEFN